MRNSYLVIGAGAIGSYIGMSLHQTNAVVVLHCRSNYDAILHNGLTISTDKAVWTSYNLLLSDNFSMAPQCSVGLLCTKSYENDAVLSALSKTRYPKTIVCMQNGIGLEEKILQYLPDVTVITAVCFIKVTPKAPNHFHHNFGKTIAIAQYQPVAKSYLSESKILEQIKNDFLLCGMSFHPGIFQDVLWTKLAFNVPLCLLSILYNESTTAIAKHSELREKFYAFMYELEFIARSEGATLDKDFIISDLKRFASAETPVFHSMKLDYDHGKKLELESLFFNILKIAKKNNTPSPLLENAILKVRKMVMINETDQKSIRSLIEQNSRASKKIMPSANQAIHFRSSL